MPVSHVVRSISECTVSLWDHSDRYLHKIAAHSLLMANNLILVSSLCVLKIIGFI